MTLTLDHSDPQDSIPFAELLYTDEDFIRSLYHALNEDGIIVFQLGEASDGRDPPDTKGKNSRRAILIERLEKLGFAFFHAYEDGYCGFGCKFYCLSMHIVDLFIIPFSKLQIHLNEHRKTHGLS